MKRIISLVAVMALAFPAAADDVDVTFSGDFRVRGQYDIVQGFDDDGAQRNNNDWSSRLNLGMDFNSGEQLSGRASFLALGTWGDDGLEDGPDVETSEYAQNPTLFAVYELYATWLLSDTTKLRVGRGAYEIGDGTVLALNDWEDLPYSFDGVIYTHEMDWARVDGFFTRLVDSDQNQGTGVDLEQHDQTNAFGVNADLKILPDMFKTANVHVAQVKKDGHAGSTPTEIELDYLRYGVTLAGDVGIADFRGTYAAYSGDAETVLGEGDYEGDMFDLEVGLNMRDMMGARFHVLYHSDSGDDAADGDLEEYDGFFYDKHNNAGLMDVVRWGNSTYVQLGLSLEPKDDLIFDIRYIMFEKTEDNGRINTEVIDGLAVVNDDDVGDEIDLSVTHKYENGLEIAARYSIFMPGDAWGPTHEDDYNQFYLQASLDF